MIACKGGDLFLAADGGDTKGLGRLFADHRRLLYEVAGKCRGTVTATTFREVYLEAATHLKLKIERIFSREGRRYAIVSPSVLAPYL